MAEESLQMRNRLHRPVLQIRNILADLPIFLLSSAVIRVRYCSGRRASAAENDKNAESSVSHELRGVVLAEQLTDTGQF